MKRDLGESTSPNTVGAGKAENEEEGEPEMTIEEIIRDVYNNGDSSFKVTLTDAVIEAIAQSFKANRMI